jgi:F-type H+-transporting ATPase subunit gamma
MPNILDLRRRIRSVKNTQQITKAMKMVAAARLRRAHERIVNARPYASEIRTLMQSAAARMEPEEQATHPLLAVRPDEKILLVLVTADRGLCGAFNGNSIRAAQSYLDEHVARWVSILAVGRKGRDYFRRRHASIVAEHVDIFSRLAFGHARAVAAEIIELYTNGTVDAVDFLYNEFKSILAQRAVVERHLPIRPIEATPQQPLVDYIYEQPPAEVFSRLVPRYVEAQVYRTLLESQAAELAARMTAMESATRNAGDMIDSLTLNMNRVRQAAITKEIIEIVSGAAAQQE